MGIEDVGSIVCDNMCWKSKSRKEALCGENQAEAASLREALRGEVTKIGATGNTKLPEAGYKHDEQIKSFEPARGRCVRDVLR